MVDFNKRYDRQIRLKGFGTVSQEKLMKARILIIGAGGLGCPALQYLTAAGAGTIGIIDNDVVELSNLHRQVIYTTDDIGLPKVEIAASRMKSLNPEIEFREYNFRLVPENSFDIIKEYDVIIDGSDNFPTRYLVNDVCVLLDKPFVYGSVQAFEGQLGVFNYSYGSNSTKINYRDLFTKSPGDDSSFSCNETGVLGVLPGIIGTMQAVEAIKIVTGIGKPLSNSILVYNALQNSFHEFQIEKNNEVIYPNTKDDILKFDYGIHCNSETSIHEITAEEFDSLISKNNLTIIDVREHYESPEVTEFKCLKIPLSELKKNLETMPVDNKIVIFCQSGSRSIHAAEIIKNKFQDIDISNLKNGIESWINFKNAKTR
jgi:sulfur-carrier protein adenylyltransferase/sulfurtransferase